MWFKTLRLYTLSKPFNLTEEQLNDGLSGFPFEPCSRFSPASLGWVPPLGREGVQLCHMTNGNLLFCLRKETKILPPTIIREQVEEKVAVMEAAQARKVGRKEKKALYDELYQALLATALCRPSQTYGYLDSKNGYLVVDAGSINRADEFVTFLQKTIDGFAVEPVTVKQSPASRMTDWVTMKHPLPTPLSFGDECVLKEVGENPGVVRCKNIEVLSDEVSAHIEAGKQVIKLGLQWQDIFSFTIEEDLSIKRLRFTSVYKESREEESEEDKAAIFDAEFALFTLEMSRFVPVVLEAFGGIDEKMAG